MGLKKALIVGINNYPECPLYGCVNDAQQINTLLSKHEDGTPNYSTKLLVGPNDSITKADLRRLLNELFIGECESSLFYFSGHGLVKSTGGYIVTQDYSKHDEGVSMDEILALANKSSAKDKIIMLDCCQAGYLGDISSLGEKICHISEGVTLLTACRSTEFAVERGGGGVFTSLLIDALKGGASDLRGHVTPGSLYAYVDEALGAWSQRPIFKTNVSHFTSIRKCTPPVPLDVLRLIDNYFPQPDFEFPLSPDYEYTVEGSDPKKVEIFKNLQKYQSARLVVPVGEEFMYWAAMNSKACKLTGLGYQYWRMAKEHKI